jgi:hypothetical protein
VDEDTENAVYVAQVELGQVHFGEGTGEAQELPDRPAGHGPVDDRDFQPAPFVEHLRGEHFGEAPGDAAGEVFAFGFHFQKNQSNLTRRKEFQFSVANLMKI